MNSQNILDRIRNPLNTLIVCYLFILSVNISAQQKNSVLDKRIILKPGKYIVEQLIDNVNISNVVNITYNNKVFSPNATVTLTKSDPTVKQLLDEIQKVLPIEYQVEGDYIILIKKNIVYKYRITGTVKDSVNGEPLIGTTIYIKGTSIGVTSDVDGSYSLKLEAGNCIIVFSYIGYKTEERNIDLTGNLELNVTMSPAKEFIEEVRVTKQRDFWGNMSVGRNISRIDPKHIELQNTNNPSELLQASVPGVWSSQTSGAPGDHQKIRIRGVSSIFGCSDPLYIIDGVAVPIVNLRSLGIGDLNIHDIEQVTVLKDAASCAIYGFQGANGVVIIDTKRKNERHISFSSKFGVQMLPRRYDLMNTRDFLSTLDTANVKGFADIRKFYPKYNDSLQSTDWQDVVFRNGIINEYQLSGSGTIGKTNFYVSGNYYTHQGIVVNSSFKRYNLAARVGRNFTKNLSAELNVRGSVQENLNNLDQYYGNDLVLLGINKSPCLKSTTNTFYQDPPRTYLKEDEYNWDYHPERTFLKGDYVRTVFGDSIPTDYLIDRAKNSLNASNTSVNLALKYLISDNLSINASTSATYRKNLYESDDVINQMIGYGPARVYYKSRENYVLLNQQLNMNYIKHIKNHEFIWTTGYRNYADNANWNLDSLGNKELIRSTGNRDDIYFMRNSLAILGDNGSITRMIQSFATHLNYNYKNKYHVSFILNRENLRVNDLVNMSNWFPSVALSWDISKETGLNRIDWLNQFNIFANWGKTGNYPVNAIAGNFYTYYPYSVNDSAKLGKTVTQFANHYLVSEISDEFNFGSEIKLFDGKMQVSADYYTKINSNLIILRDIPYYFMGGKMMHNIGEILNKGLEIKLEQEAISMSNFSWYSTFSISFNWQKIRKIGLEKQIYFTSDDILTPDFVIDENQALGNIMGYKYLGKWDKSTVMISNGVINSGGSKYLKIDTTFTKLDPTDIENLLEMIYLRNHPLNDKDKVNLGNSIPDYTWYWSNTLIYKNLSMDFLWYGVAGVHKFNATKAATYMAATNREINNFLQPGRKTLSDPNFYQSSYFVEDASFIRLKRITFTYLVPEKIIKHGDLRLSVSLDNFFTITKYSGYDPEASIYTDNSFSDFAIDRGAYPVPKSVYFTIKLDL